MSRHMLAAALGGAVVMTLGSCADLTDTRDDGPTSLTFRCDDDRRFLAMFSEDRRRSFVKTNDETYELMLVDRDGDAVEYADRNGVRLTVDGDDGDLRVPEDDDFEDCTT
jgi:hypothetical protein